MMRERTRLERLLVVVAVAFGLGLAAAIAGVALLDSRAVVGVSLIWIFGVLLFALRTFRCPLCGAMLLYFPIGVAVRWIRTTPRLCPRCRTDYYAAAAEIGRGRGRSS